MKKVIPEKITWYCDICRDSINSTPYPDTWGTLFLNRLEKKRRLELCAVCSDEAENYIVCKLSVHTNL